MSKQYKPKTHRKCRACQQLLPLADFGKQGSHVGGQARRYHISCKKCRQDAYRKRRLGNENDPLHVRLTQLPDADAPHKRRARRELWVEQGFAKSDNPCWLCGSTKNVDRHHPVYDKPLEFIDLCRSCHIWAHRHRPGCRSEEDVWIDYTMASAHVPQIKRTAYGEDVTSRIGRLDYE